MLKSIPEFPSYSQELSIIILCSLKDINFVPIASKNVKLIRLVLNPYYLFISKSVCLSIFISSLADINVSVIKRRHLIRHSAKIVRKRLFLRKMLIRGSLEFKPKAKFWLNILEAHFFVDLDMRPDRTWMPWLDKGIQQLVAFSLSHLLLLLSKYFGKFLFIFSLMVQQLFTTN